MKLLLLLSTIVMITACVSLPAKKEISKDFFSSELVSLDGKRASYESIKSEMKRSDGEFGMWEFEAYPLTKALLIAQRQEDGSKNMDSQDKINANIKESLSLAEKDTCFAFVVRTNSIIETAQFKNWRAKLFDHENKEYEITFTKTMDVPEIGGMSGGSPMGYSLKWSSASIGCIGKRVDLTKPFKLYAIPQIKMGYEEKKAELAWIVK